MTRITKPGEYQLVKYTTGTLAKHFDLNARDMKMTFQLNVDPQGFPKSFWLQKPYYASAQSYWDEGGSFDQPAGSSKIRSGPSSKSSRRVGPLRKTARLSAKCMQVGNGKLWLLTRCAGWILRSYAPIGAI